MALPPDFLEELRDALRELRTALPSGLPDTPGRGLESWLLMRLAVVAKRSTSWEVTLCDADGRPLPITKVFVFATRRGKLPSGPGQRKPCHVRLRRTTSCHDLLAAVEPERHVGFELHTNVEWKGRSGATHEWDVSMLASNVGDALREKGGGHPRGLPLLGFECKDRTASGDLDECRQTLARMFDLALITRACGRRRCRMFGEGTRASWGESARNYVSHFQDSAFAIVRASDADPGARTLASHYGIDIVEHVYAGGDRLRQLEGRYERLLEALYAE